MRYNNNTSSGHASREPRKPYQPPAYAEEYKERAWIARLAEEERRRAKSRQKREKPTP